MLYKVTPMMEPEPAKKPKEPGAPRKRRASAIYDRDGNEVLVSLMCLKCKKVKPLVQFGLRRMADGAIRNQPWCRTCRSGASANKVKREAEAAAEAAAMEPPPSTSPQIVAIEAELIPGEAMRTLAENAPLETPMVSEPLSVSPAASEPAADSAVVPVAAEPVPDPEHEAPTHEHL